MPTFMVIRTRGPAWEQAKPLRAQAGWDEHARFMEQRLTDGFVLLGGLTNDDDKVLLVVEAPTDNAVREQLSRDPWHVAGLLLIERVARWEVLLDFRRAGR